MNRTDVVVIGAGQAGLAVSYLLTAAAVDHVVLERGRTAQSWRSRRWESLHLLTPNWMSRLPGWSYRGADLSGFMPASSVATYLSDYADSFHAPVLPGAEVRSVRWRDGGYDVVSHAGRWTADSVVVATGYADVPAVPQFARDLDPSILQLTPDRYRNPDSVPDGGVLVVGASASGVQLADELAGAGRDVVLAVGRHARMPRRYRGMDIMWWLDSMGVLDRPLQAQYRSRPGPSLQIVGSTDGREVDLRSLAARGIHLTGRVAGTRGRMMSLDDDLRITTAAADARLQRLLRRVDEFATVTGLDAEVEPSARPAPSVDLHTSETPSELDLHGRGIRSVIWATGFRRRYPWLQLPVLDANGEIQHTAGRTVAPGLMVVGMQRQTRRSSTFLDGVRHDAELVVTHLIEEVLTGSGTHRRAS
jgi:putative flavoprotein involved in K+ transport